MELSDSTIVPNYCTLRLLRVSEESFGSLVDLGIRRTKAGNQSCDPSGDLLRSTIEKMVAIPKQNCDVSLAANENSFMSCVREDSVGIAM